MRARLPKKVAQFLPIFEIWGESATYQGITDSSESLFLSNVVTYHPPLFSREYMTIASVN